jgi:hypothetical protein
VRHGDDRGYCGAGDGAKVQMMRKTIGWAILTAIMAGLFAVHVHQFGILIALGVWTVAILITALIVYAIKLTT